MTLPDITTDLARRLPNLRGRMMANASMADLSWFRAGGPAQVLFTPADEADLAYFLAQLPLDIPVIAVGLGSNLLVREGGFAGVVIRLSPKGFGAVSALSATQLTAGTAARDKSVAEAAANASIGGLEFYYGIPGSIGGALRMNAGANGGETKDVLVSARAVDRAGNIHVLSNADMKFAYRVCGASPDLIFTQATFEGRAEPQEVILERMAAVAHHRETVQPVKERTGGSTFKNPPGNSAWKVIDAAGLRGYRVGGAHMSELHCNFLINDRDATPYDIELLGESVRAKVKAHSGVELHWEIKRIGAFAVGREISPAF